MKKSWFIFSAVILFTVFGLVQVSNSYAEEICLVTDSIDESALLPAQFRTMQDDFKTQGISKSGLKNLLASGSVQPSASQILNIRNKFRRYKLVIVDLRQESHGIINNTIPVSWHKGNNDINLGKNLIQIESDEKMRLNELLEEKQITVFEIECSRKEKKVEVLTAQTEAGACQRAGVGYLRIPVTDHHRPLDSEVDRFISFIKGLDKNTWLHFHCRGGKGRTTTFLAMYDIMRNVEKSSLDDIIMRQKLLGGSNLFSYDEDSLEKTPFAAERAEFIKNFYRYCKDNSADGFRQSWSEWLFHSNKP